MTQIFNFNGIQIRTVQIDGQPWFVLKDVCEALEINHIATVKQRLSEDVVSNHPLQTAGGMQQTTILNEDGLYDVILESRKPEAKAFRKWITSEVLPTIRKHGAYMTPETIERTLNDPDFIISLAQQLKQANAEKASLQLQNAQKEQIINELQPKATYYDLVLQNKSTIAITKIAKDYGMTAQALNTLLKELGVQYKQGECWLLKKDYADKGYTQSKTHVIDDERSALRTQWTQKGRLFIYELLKRERDILPVIERELIK